MATVTRFVNPSSTPGGDGTTNATAGANRAYASLSEWEAAEQTDLVSDGDIHVVECDDGVDTTARLILDGWTTGASNYIEIKAAAGAECNGVARANSGVGYRFAPSSVGPFRIQEDFVRCEGFEIDDPSGASGPTLQSAGTPGGSSDQRYQNLLVISTSGGSVYGIDVNAAYTALFENCLVISDGRGADFRTGTNTVDHCGFWINGGTLGIVADNSSTITNTWCMGASSEDFWTGGSTPSGSHNASADTSVSTDYTSSLASRTAANEFTSPSATPATFDFSLKAGNTLAGAGTGSLANDIAGNPYGSPSDIGPFAEAASSSAAITGTITATIDESDIVTGGKTIIITLTGDTFVTGTVSEDGIAGGSDSDKTGANKWDALIKGDLDNTNVVLSGGDTIATITLPAYASYDPDEQEVITWTIPGASLTGGSPIVATPTFTIDAVSGFQAAWANGSNVLIQGGLS